MDAAQKIIRTAILSATALLLSTAGLAQTTPTLNAPASVTIGNTGSAFANVSSSAAGTTEITYAYTVDYSGDQTASGNWLTVSASSLTTPSTLSFGLRGNTTAGITQGASAVVTLTPSSPSGVAPIAITVTFGGGSSGGGGSSVLIASPSQLNFPLAASSTSTQPVNIYTTGSTNLSILSAVSNVSWLTVDLVNSSVTPNPSPGTIYVTASSANLSNTTYSGIITVTPSTGTPLTINVTMTVGGGTGTGGWIVSPSTSVSWSYTTGGGLTVQHFTVTPPNGAGTYNVSSVSSSGGWLVVSDGTNNGSNYNNVPVNLGFDLKTGSQVTLLSPGTYIGQAFLTDSNGANPLTITVNLSVNGGGSGGSGGTSAIAPTSLQFTYQLGTPPTAVAHQKLVITGPAGAWSATSNATWLKITPSSGSSLPNPENPNDAPVVYVDPTGLTGTGPLSGQITIVAPGGSTNIQVSLNVVASTILLPTPGSLIFTAQSGQGNPPGQGVFVSYSDGGLNLSSAPVTSVSNNDWITLTGPTENGVTVNVNQTGKTTGVYTGSFSFNDKGGAILVTVPVVLVVNGGGSGGSGGSGSLTFSQNSFAFSAVNGNVTPVSQTLTVSSTSAVTFTGSITYAPNNAGNWLNVSPLSGTTTVPVTISLTPNATGLPNGTYNATITFTANNVPQTVVVSMTVSSNTGGNTGNVNVLPPSLTFTAQQGSNPAVQTVNVTSASGAAGIPFTVLATTTGGGAWLSTNASTNNSAPSTFTVTAASAGLAAGTYNGNIQIQPNGGTTVNIPVTLTVTSPPTVSATPTSLTFDYRLGDTAPVPKPLTVAGGGGTLAFSATASSTGNWLVVSPTSGTTPGTVNVSINPSSFSNTGTFNGTVTVAGASGAQGSTTVNVTVNVTAPLPTLTRVTNAASYAAGSISPGEIITLFAADPTHPIGPATPVGLTLDSTGKVATKIGNVEVLINGYACPMIFASATQLSAVVPYEAKLFTRADVFVRFLGQSSNAVSVNVATTQPGIFTANASGTGPGAILNSNSTINSPSNPATRGDVIVVYLTGEGETSPAGVTGKVTTVAAPPNPLTPGPLLPVSVTIAGQGAQFTFAGEAPGFVSGVMQLNVIVPTGIPAGDQVIQVTIGGNQSQAGVTVSLR